jgi:hypothetical protein
MEKSNRTSGDNITCPKCGEIIPITETLQHQLTERARAEMNHELADEQKALVEREKGIRAKEASLAVAERDIDERVAKKLFAEKARLSKDAFDKARAEVSLQLDDLQADAAEKDRKLQEAQKKELQLRKETRELQAAKDSFDLDVARTVDAERQGIRQQAMAQAAQEHHLKDAEKDKKLSDALKINEDLNRKLQQGSQQTQGEVLELELEKILLDCCRFDEILPVPKDVRGADVFQKVNDRLGTCCGLIIWEAKHTKNWSDGWIPKLKEDQQAAHADVAVLVTDVLPKELDHFGRQDGVWITSPQYVRGLVAVLRHEIEEVAKTKRAVASKNETVEGLFNYLTGADFANRVEAIMRGFIGMRQTLDEEKRTTTRRWAKREKQLDIVIANTSGMHGDLQGLLGASLKPIPFLDSEDPNSPDEGSLSLAAEAGT